MPRATQFPKPSLGNRTRARAGIWDDSFPIPLDDSFDDVSMVDTWSTQGTDATMPDLYIVSPPSAPPEHGLHGPIRPYGDGKNKSPRDDTRQRPREAKQVVVTMREDQFGRLVEAFSSPKKSCEGEDTFNRHDFDHHHSTQTTALGSLPKMGTVGAPISTRSSTAALARTASYADHHPHLRNASNKPSPIQPGNRRSSKEEWKSPLTTHSLSTKGKENRNPSGNHDLTPYPFEGRMPTPHPHLQGPVWGSSNRHDISFGSDVSMRNPSLLFSNQPCFDKVTKQWAETKNSPALTPASTGNIKSRKEGISFGSPAATDLDVRHDKSLLPTVDAAKQSPAKEGHTTSDRLTTMSPQARIEEILIIDEPKPFVPGHRSGMSSIERVEKTLFSALGEEFSFNENMASTAVGNGALSGLEDFDSPLVKRKRQGTLGGERGRSPDTKILREEAADTGPQPTMRGD